MQLPAIKSLWHIPTFHTPKLTIFLIDIYTLFPLVFMYISTPTHHSNTIPKIIQDKIRGVQSKIVKTVLGYIGTPPAKGVGGVVKISGWKIKAFFFLTPIICTVSNKPLLLA
jgi:hypothetical protein